MVGGHRHPPHQGALAGSLRGPIEDELFAGETQAEAEAAEHGDDGQGAAGEGGPPPGGGRSPDRPQQGEGGDDEGQEGGVAGRPREAHARAEHEPGEAEEASTGQAEPVARHGDRHAEVGEEERRGPQHARHRSGPGLGGEAEVADPVTPPRHGAGGQGHDHQHRHEAGDGVVVGQEPSPRGRRGFLGVVGVAGPASLGHQVGGHRHRHEDRRPHHEQALEVEHPGPRHPPGRAVTQGTVAERAVIERTVIERTAIERTVGERGVEAEDQFGGAGHEVGRQHQQGDGRRPQPVTSLAGSARHREEGESGDGHGERADDGDGGEGPHRRARASWRVNGSRNWSHHTAARERPSTVSTGRGVPATPRRRSAPDPAGAT